MPGRLGGGEVGGSTQPGQGPGQLRPLPPTAPHPPSIGPLSQSSNVFSGGSEAVHGYQRDGEHDAAFASDVVTVDSVSSSSSSSSSIVDGTNTPGGRFAGSAADVPSTRVPAEQQERSPRYGSGSYSTRGVHPIEGVPQRNSTRRLSESVHRRTPPPPTASPPPCQHHPAVTSADTTNAVGARGTHDAPAAAPAAAAASFPSLQSPNAEHGDDDEQSWHSEDEGDAQRPLHRTQRLHYLRSAVVGSYEGPPTFSSTPSLLSSVNPPVPDDDPLSEAEVEGGGGATALPRTGRLRPRSAVTAPEAGAAPPLPTAATPASSPSAAASPAALRRSNAAPGSAALARGARMATTAERRVRTLFHNRPHIQLTVPPEVTSCVVQDRSAWEQPLCYPPLLLPWMDNAFYALSLDGVVRRSLLPVVANPLSPSLLFAMSGGNQADRNPLQQRVAPLPASTPSESQALLPGAALYYVPPSSWTRRHLRRGSSASTAGAAAGRRRQRLGVSDQSRTGSPHAGQEGGGEEQEGGEGGEEGGRQDDTAPTTEASVPLRQKVRHLLYRCFCVRCAVAAQAQALQADAKMRAAAPRPFPVCGCLGVESRPYRDLLMWMCLLDCLTLGLPCGCCCYHGLGTTLVGWQLRFLLRARYRIHAWTAVDLLIMGCVPGLAVDQQGAELLLNGVPEEVVALQFMS